MKRACAVIAPMPMKRIEGVVTGGYQCGAICFRATATLDNAHLRHCRMCQKAVGNAFAAL